MGLPAGATRGDPGLAAERTALAWVRMGMSMLAVPGGLLAYAFGRSGVAVAAAAVAWVLGLALLVVSLRKRDPALGPALRLGHLAGLQVVLTAAAATFVGVASIAVVLLPR